MMRIISSAVVTGLLIAACNTTKKTPAQADTLTFQLDTINVVSGNPSKREVYRASTPRSNDILHTKLEVSFDWQKCRMNGKATISLRPYFYPVRNLHLNARGMDINKVEVIEKNKAAVTYSLMNTAESEAADRAYSPGDGAAAQFADPADAGGGPAYYSYRNDSITISFGKYFRSEETYTVVIDYVAKPNELKSPGGSTAISEDKGLYFINPTGESPFKMQQIWTQGETQASSVWFPTIDSPNERMTQEILMKVDDKFVTLSNGVMVSSQKQADGTRIDHWKLDQPHAPYLAMMAVGTFKKVMGEPWNGKEVSYYVDALYEQDAKEIFGDTREMIDFYSTLLGVPYPWPKYAQVVVKDYVSGAMENTSATLHGDFIVYQTAREMQDHKKGYGVIAHELFHQWFGDLVTCESWSNLPLNESFATYGEYLWEEYKYGIGQADYHRWQSKQGYLNATKEVDLIRFHYHDKEDMFDAFSYNKGGQILHMLRKAVGDKAFFASLKNYLETNKFKSVEIHNLRLAFEETTGKDLNWFFDQWFLSPGRPSLKITKQSSKDSDTLKLTIEQTQDLGKYPLYTLPVEIDLYRNGFADKRRITITEQKQTFTFPNVGTLQLVNFDAQRQLLADVDFPKTTAEYMFQYRTCPLYEDRYEALKELSTKMADEPVYKLFKEAAEQDRLYQIRLYALQQLEKVEAQKEDLKAFLTRFYLSEKHPLVRAKALGALNKLFPGSAEINNFNLAALKEPSYAICAEALNALAKNDPKKAMEHAHFFERESGKDILFAVASLYASHGGDGQIHFYSGALKYIHGFDLMGFSAFYAKAGRQCSIPENALMAARDLELVAKGSNKYVKFTAVKGIKDILSAWESKESSAQVKRDNAKKENKSTAELDKELAAATKTKLALQEIYNRIK